MRVIIVGGVAGGATAAARLRRLDENAEIVVFERSGYVSYANCGLPYYVGGVIEQKEALTLQTPESFWSRFRVDVRVRHEVTAIDTANRTVTVRDLANDIEFTETYDKLLLSPGAKPVIPPVPGVDGPRVFTLRTVEDTFRIHDFVERTRPRRAVVVGGGYIGLEMAENLVERGIAVTVLQRPKQLMNTLDYDMAALVHAEVRAHGVDLRLEADVVGFEDSGNGVRVLLAGGAVVDADLAILAVGVQPDNALAKAAGVALGMKGAIAVNDRMETSAPDVYAVGDAVSVRHSVSGEEAVISLAGPANKQGRIAADNVCGGDSRYRGSQGSSIIKVFDLTVAGTGLTVRAAQAAGIDCDRVVLSPGSHAGYYPGAETMTLKVVCEKGTLRLLGAQIVGYSGADKRLDVLATAISAGVRASP